MRGRSTRQPRAGRHSVRSGASVQTAISYHRPPFRPSSTKTLKKSRRSSVICEWAKSECSRSRQWRTYACQQSQWKTHAIDGGRWRLWPTGPPADRPTIAQWQRRRLTWFWSVLVGAFVGRDEHPTGAAKWGTAGRGVLGGCPRPSAVEPS